MTTSPDTPSLLSECRTALGAASPGPWEIRVTMPGTPSEMTDVWRGTEDEGEYVAQDVAPEDGTLIVAARKVIPRLLAAVEAVLEAANSWDAEAHEIPGFKGIGASAYQACAREVRAAITAALAGTDRENVSSSTAATGEDEEP